MSTKENVKVDVGVPFPKRDNRGRPRGPHSDTLASLEVGESFLYPVRKNLRSARATVYIWKKRLAPLRKFQTAVEDVDGVQHIRVWRTA